MLRKRLFHRLVPPRPFSWHTLVLCSTLLRRPHHKFRNDAKRRQEKIGSDHRQSHGSCQLFWRRLLVPPTFRKKLRSTVISSSVLLHSHLTSQVVCHSHVRHRSMGLGAKGTHRRARSRSTSRCKGVARSESTIRPHCRTDTRRYTSHGTSTRLLALEHCLGPCANARLRAASPARKLTFPLAVIRRIAAVAALIRALTP